MYEVNLLQIAPYVNNDEATLDVPSEDWFPVGTIGLANIQAVHLRAVQKAYPELDLHENGKAKENLVGTKASLRDTDMDLELHTNFEA